jgi:hypothetical protein
MAPAEDEEPVQAFTADGADKPLADRVRAWRHDGVGAENPIQAIDLGILWGIGGVRHQNLDRCPELAVFATSDHDRPWPSSSVTSACAGSSACSNPLGGPRRTRTSRSWCSATRCVSSSANSMRASPTALWIGRSSPPSPGCWRDGAGDHSSSRQRRSFAGTESSRGANGGAGDPLVALVGRPCPMSSSSSSSGSPERTGAGARC